MILVGGESAKGLGESRTHLVYLWGRSLGR